MCTCTGPVQGWPPWARAVAARAPPACLAQLGVGDGALPTHLLHGQMRGTVLRVQHRPRLWLTNKQVGLGQPDIPRPRATFLRSQQVQTCYNLCWSSRGQRGHEGGVEWC